MSCPINNGQEFFEGVLAELHKIMRNSQKFNLNDFIKMMYDKVQEEVGNDTSRQGLAVDVIKNLPRTIIATGADVSLLMYLSNNGLNVLDLVRLANQFDNITPTEGQTDMEAVEQAVSDLLGLGKKQAQIAQDLKDKVLYGGSQLQNPRVQRLKSEDFEAKPYTISSTTMVTYQLVDDNNNIISQIKARELGITPKKVLRPETQYYAEFIRHISGAIDEASATGGRVLLPGTSVPLYITAKTLDSIPREQLYESFTSEMMKRLYNLVQVITDRNGNPIYFDQNYNITSEKDGKMIYFRFRKEESGIQTINDAVKTHLKNYIFTKESQGQQVTDQDLAVEEALFRKRYAAQIDVKNKTVTYLKKNPEGFVVSEINGFSNGFIDSKYFKATPLKAVNTSGQNVRVELTEALGQYQKSHAVLKVGSQPPVGIYSYGVPDNYVDLITDFLTEDVYDSEDPSKKVMSNFNKSNIIDQYLYKSKSDFAISKLEDGKFLISLGTDISGQQVDKATAKDMIRKYLTEKQDRETKSGIKPGNKILNISKKYLNDPLAFNDFTLEPAENGMFKMVPTGKTYMDFIFDNFTIEADLDNNGRLRGENPYVTFSIKNIQESRDKISPPKEMPVTPTIDLNTLPDFTSPADIPINDLDDIFNQIKNNKGLSKTLAQKSLNKNEFASDEELREVLDLTQEWYKTTKLDQSFSLNVLFNVVNSNAVATWVKDAINLYAGSDYTDLFHEAYHGFTQKFLTKKQKEDLWDELSNVKGDKTFTTFKGQTKAFKDATNRELDEYLAEEFRDYMIKNAKIEVGRRKADNIFKRIYNFLKNLFGKSAAKDSTLRAATTYNTSLPLINEIFQKLALGNIDEYIPSDDNIIDQYLEKSIVSEDGEDALSKTESEQMNSAASSIISELADRLNASQGTAEYTTQLLVKPSNRTLAYQYVQRSFANRLATVVQDYKALVQTQPAEGTPQYDKYISNKATLEYQIRVLKTTLDNFGDPNNPKNTFGFVKFFEDNGYPILHLKKLELDEDFDETVYVAEQARGYELSGNENAMTEMASKQTLALVESLHLPKLNPKGGYAEPQLDTKTGELKYDFEKDVFGFKKLVDFDVVWNRLSQILDNVDPDEQVFKAKLAAEAKDYPWIYQLLEKLGNENTMDAWTSSVWGNFVKDFNFTRINLKQLLVEETRASDGTRSASATFGVTSSSSKSAAVEWEEDFQLNTLNPYMIYDETGNKLDVKKVLDAFRVNYTGRELDFFKAIGIKLVNKPEVLKAILTSPTKKGSGRVQDWIKKLIAIDAAGYEVRSIRDIVIDRKDLEKDGETLKFPNLATIYKTLQSLHLKYADDRSDFMALRPDGNAQYEFTRNSTVTVQLRGLNQYPTYAEMIADARYKHYDMRVNPWIEDSYLMNDMYDLKGDGSRKKDAFGYKNAQIDLANLAGTSFLVNDLGDGLANIDLDDYSKLVQDIHVVMLNGSTEGPRAAGKPFTLLINSNARDFYVAPEDFISIPGAIQATAPQMIVNQMIKYLSAEVERMKWLKANPDSFAANAPVGKVKYGEIGQDFSVFSKILSNNTKEDIRSVMDTLGDEKLKDFLSVPEDKIQGLRSAIARDILEYFGRLSNDTISALSSVVKLYPEARPYIDNNVLNTVKSRASNKGITLAISDKVVTDAVIQSYAFNAWVHNLELTVLLFGDPAQYDHAKEDFSKRIAPFQSPGVFPILSKPRLNYANEVLGSPYVDSPWFKGVKPKMKKAFGETANLIIFDEAIRTSVYLNTWTKAVEDDDLKALRKTEMYKEASPEMQTALEKKVSDEVSEMMREAYENMKKGDGQGWGAFDFYRFLSDAMGAWNPQQEELYQKILKKENITLSNSNLTKIFPVLKMQYTGPYMNEGLPVVGLIKFSLFPLIPNVIENTVLEDIHNKLVEQGKDFATYQSGSKLAGVSSPLWKSVEDGTTFLNDPGYQFNDNIIHLGYFKKQAENKDEYKESTNLATQLRSIITNNFNEFGVPADYKSDLPASERIKAWEELSESDKLGYPKYKAYQEYKQALLDLTLANTEKTYKKFGQSDKEGNRAKNIEELVRYLKEQLAVLNMPSHVIDNISFNPATGKISTDLSLTFGADEIEKLLTSIINKTIVKPKITGDQLVQVSNSGFMSKNHQEVLDSYRDADGKLDMARVMKELGSGDLPSYTTDSDGYIVPQGVKIAMRKEFKPLLKTTAVQDLALQENITPLQALNRLIRNEDWLNQRMDDTVKNKDLITFVSVRIPTAKENFIEYSQIYEFLEESAGPIFVGPMELVGKSGTDFDNDKQVSYFPNIAVKRNFTKEILSPLSSIYTDLNLSVKNLNRIFDMVEEDGVDSLSEEDKAIYDIGYKASNYGIKLSTFGTKGAQNKVLTSMKNMIQYNMTLSDFVRPVTIVNAKSLADKAAKKLASETTYNPKRNQDGSLGSSINPTVIFEPLYNIKKLSENSVGFKSLGIGAVGIKYNPLFNAANLALRMTYQTGKNKYTKDVSIKFAHNIIFIDDIPYISLASNYSANSYKKIANQLEELLNGWVDVEKDAWIFYLNGVKIVAPVMITLLEAGVSQEDIAAFVNQPIVREYVKRQALLASPFAKILNIAPKNPNYSQGKARADILRSLGQVASEDGTRYYETSEWFSEGLAKSVGLILLDENEAKAAGYQFNQNLEKAIETFYNEFEEANGYQLTQFNLFNAGILDPNVGKPAGNYSGLDIAVLFEYFKAEDLAKAPKDIKQNINFDTKKGTTIFDMVQKDFGSKLLIEDPRFYGPSIKKLFSDSVISMFNVADIAKDLLGDNLFALREDASVNNFINREGMTFKAISTNSFAGDMSTTIKEFKNGLVQFLLQNYINEVNIDKLKSFSGLIVKDEIPVKDAPALRSFGAFVQNGILYINKDVIKRNHANLSSQDLSNQEVGTAKVTSLMLPHLKEYANFVLTREVLRDTLDIESLMASPEFADAKKKIIEARSKEGTLASLPIAVKTVTSTIDTEFDQLVLESVRELGLETKGYTKKTDIPNQVEADYQKIIREMYGVQESSSEKAIYSSILNLESSDGTVVIGNANSKTVKILEDVAKRRNIPIIINPSAFTLRKFLSENNIRNLNISNNVATISEKNKEIYKQILTIALKPSQNNTGGTVLRQAYEMVLRDKALDAIYNSYKIFQGTPEGGLSYAEKVYALKNKYPGIDEVYPLLSTSGLRIAYQKGNKTGIKTLKLATKRPSANYIERLREDYEALSNPAKNMFNIPYSDKEEIAKLIGMLPMVISLSTGISAKGEHALWKVVPDNSILGLKKEAVKAATKQGKIPDNVLRAALIAFAAENSIERFSLRNRYRKYIVSEVFNKMGLSESTKDLIDDATKTEKAPITFSTDYSGNRVYSIKDSNDHTKISKFVKIQPQTVFLYNGTTNSDARMANPKSVAGIMSMVALEQPNVLPIRTFGDKYMANNSLTDDTYAANVQMIDEDIARIEDYLGTISGNVTVIMPELGLGQGMLGASDFRKIPPNALMAKAPKTFLYLSQQLLGRFGLYNTNSDSEVVTKEAGPADATFVTDAMVLEVINQRLCFKQ